MSLEETNKCQKSLPACFHKKVLNSNTVVFLTDKLYPELLLNIECSISNITQMFRGYSSLKVNFRRKLQGFDLVPRLWNSLIRTADILGVNMGGMIDWREMQSK